MTGHIEKILSDNNIMAVVYNHYEIDRVYVVEIEWGDWKHDHLRTKWLLEQEKLHFIKTSITEEDGSDTYSAMHYFYKED